MLEMICGAERDRTVDLRLAKPALSQLSYSPGTRRDSPPVLARAQVGQGRLELPTSRLSGVRSNHLSYWPECMIKPHSTPGNWIVCFEKAGYDPRFVPRHVLRKEVIQPQVPLRLPCYDFTPVTSHSLGPYLPCGLV